ncbi:hypothetical protein ONZ45_g2531 [Pleurotus djamor]|nr:hypothetical protein ONZ45_g2531 [Pleurotus djamor]
MTDLYIPSYAASTGIGPSRLPEYSPSSPAPDYSDEPLSGEERLEHSPRPTRSPPTGVFVKKAGRTQVILNEQEEGVRVPLYGRHGVISGAIYLENPSIVEEVTIKLDGKLDLTITEGGSKSHSLVNDSYKLWSRSSENRTCPGTVTFTLLFPANYQDGDKERPLPPSYESAFPGVPGLFAKCYYTLTISIAKIRHRKMAFFTKTKTIPIRLKYYPRTRPHRPNLTDACLFSTIKAAPEEWHQASAEMQTRPTAKISPIDCHLMVPSAQIFGIQDTIPFHVQLSGPIASLRAFLPHLTADVFPLSTIDTASTIDPHVAPPSPTSALSPTTTAVSSSFSLKSKAIRFSTASPPLPKPIIRVFILRQISVEVRGQKAWRNCNIGEGTLTPLPPPAGSRECLVAEGEEKTAMNLDWEGEVRVNKDVDIGGFNAGKLAVKDFLVLALTPPDPHTSPLLEFQHAHPIRLVTDPWTDMTGHELDQLTSR